MIKYLGSKRTLIPLIQDAVGLFPSARSVIDLFSGTSRVGHALKRAGYQVFANDHNAYAATLARCYVEADRDDVAHDAERLVRELNALPGYAGYFTDTFCERSRFFQPRNGERIDAIRDAIVAKALEPELEAVMLTSLMEAADRVDSTTGVQMAYLKRWAPRAEHTLELRVPEVLPRAVHGKGHASSLDALEAARTLVADVAYLDPPYNQHSYRGNYHIWETLVRWDRPETYGVACKRTDCRTRTSPFNSRPRFAAALEAVLEAVRARHLVVSFSDEGYVEASAIRALLERRGEVHVLTRPYKRYVGAQIGIFNPRGERVGQAGALSNREHVFVCSPDPIDRDWLAKLVRADGRLAVPRPRARVVALAAAAPPRRSVRS